MPEANYKPLQPLAADVSVAGGAAACTLASAEAATPLPTPAYVDNLATVNKGGVVRTPGTKPGVQYAMERKHAGVFADGGAFGPHGPGTPRLSWYPAAHAVPSQLRSSGPPVVQRGAGLEHQAQSVSRSC
jgi:hypothetical protein